MRCPNARHIGGPGRENCHYVSGRSMCRAWMRASRKSRLSIVSSLTVGCHWEYDKDTSFQSVPMTHDMNPPVTASIMVKSLFSGWHSISEEDAMKYAKWKMGAITMGRS